MMQLTLYKIKKMQDASLEIWKDALTNVMPHVEVRSRRVGGATFQIQCKLDQTEKISMAMKWLILYSRRNEKSMAQRLASECLAAAKEEGAAVKKRMDTHKMAEANKAFSHDFNS
jgi:small subunit ribosomal protein S7